MTATPSHIVYGLAAVDGVPGAKEDPQNLPPNQASRLSGSERPQSLIAYNQLSPPYELSGSCPQVPAAKVLRGDRPGSRYPHAEKCDRAGTHGAWLHLQRAPWNRENDRGSHPGHGPELPLF